MEAATSMMCWIVYITILCLTMKCDGARILAFLPMPLHSHQNTFRPIMRGLTMNGHDVTLVTSLPDPKAPYKQIVINAADFDLLFENLDLYEMRKSSWFGDMFTVTKFFRDAMEVICENPEIQKLIHSTESQFDLVILESTFYQEAFAVLGHKFGTPVIELAGLSPSFWVYHLIGNPYSLSYSVTYYTYSSDRMSFMERLRNTVMGVTTVLLSRYVFLPKQQMIADKYFKYPGWEGRPHLLQMLQNTSLLLQNTAVATHYPHPYNPNVIEIAGLQVQTPTKLPQDLQKHLDDAKEGVIYFSLGSVIQSSKMPENAKQAFISAFSKLPYKVLWKWETEHLPNKPNNVYISKWFPQAGVLAHPNIKAFLTHGGLASMTEAVYHGVPLVAIPLFIDQIKNSKQLEANGNGIIIDFENITEKSISWALNTVITQPSYRAMAQKQSKIFRDNPLPPLERAVYWIEYVLRHKGAPHLRTAAANLPWYQYFLIDVAVVFLTFVVLVLVVLYLVFRTVYRLICSSSERVNNKVLKKKKN